MVQLSCTSTNTQTKRNIYKSIGLSNYDKMMIAITTLFILTLKLIFIFDSTSLQTSSAVIIKTTNLRQRQLPSPPELESPPLRNLQSDRAEDALSEVGTSYMCVQYSGLWFLMSYSMIDSQQQPSSLLRFPHRPPTKCR